MIIFHYRGFNFFYDSVRLAYLLYSNSLEVEALEVPLIPGLLASIHEEYRFVSGHIDVLIANSCPF